MAKRAAAEPTSSPRDAATLGRQYLDPVIEEFEAAAERWRGGIQNVSSGKAILDLDRPTQAVLVRAAVERLTDFESTILKFVASQKENTPQAHVKATWQKVWNPRRALKECLADLLRRELPLEESTVVGLVRWPAASPQDISSWVFPLSGIVKAVECHAKRHGISNELRRVLDSFVERVHAGPNNKEARKCADRLEALLGGPRLKLIAGEAWSDAAVTDLERLQPPRRKALEVLLRHCQTGGATRLTSNWQEEAKPLLAAVGEDVLKEYLLRWFRLVDRPRTKPLQAESAWVADPNQLLIDLHVELLRGLVWCCAFREDADLARALALLAISAYRKIPVRGPRLPMLGNACVTALGMMPGLAPIGQLALLKVKVKFGTAQKEIEKAFTAAAARENLPRDEIEELAVPSYGLEEVGRREETFGDYRAELVVDGSSAALRWSKDDKALKSVPAAVKKEHAGAFKELQAAVKDVAAMLPAQRERLDGLFLARKTWPLAVWRERYLDHPLVGTIARRLIWSFAQKSKTVEGIWHDQQVVDADVKQLKLAADAAVALWHPIGRPMDDVLAWRDWLERREVVQPFKQAHREVYPLTTAERQTRTYSNRFAAHVLRQHQFHALCAARGWKNKLRLLVDDTYPPAQRLLPAWNLRAEFWVEGAGDNFGTDTNDAGAFLYLTTDQVRFYPLAAASSEAHASGGGYQPASDDPLPLEAIPSLVFSEVMRDVDLFVGVASVGNDPNWADGGPDGRYRTYWENYSFGALSATAQTRREYLERLLPRLRIAGRCSLSERFLVVRGDVRTYKIHLGSGNILMAPNDQYLCIVPKQAVVGHERVFLPFEGDATLSVILSKAFLLAGDATISDPSITSQIRR